MFNSSMDIFVNLLSINLFVIPVKFKKLFNRNMEILFFRNKFLLQQNRTTSLEEIKIFIPLNPCYS